MEQNFKYCYNCGQRLPKIANYCVQCGTKQDIDVDGNYSIPVNNQVVYTSNVNNKKVTKNSVFNVLSRSLIFALSIVLIVFAFLPTTSLVYEDSSILNVNAIDSITFMFDSFESLTEEELKETELYEQLEETVEELGKELSNIEIEDYDDLSRKEKEKFKEFVYYTLRLTLQSEDAVASVDIIISGVLSIIYLVFVLGFFIISLLNFIGIFINRLSKLKTVTLVLLALIPGISVLMYYVTTAILSNAFPTAMGIGTLLSIILSSSVIIFEFVSYLVNKEDSLATKDVIFNSIKLALSVTLLFLVFVPFTSSIVEGEHNAIIDNNVFTFYNFVYSEKDLEIMEQWEKLDMAGAQKQFETLFKAFNLFKNSEIKSGYANSVNISLLFFAGATIGNYETNFPLFVMIPVLIMLALMAIIVIMHQSIMYFISGKTVRFLSFFSSLGQALLVIISFVFTIIFFVIINDHSIAYYGPEGYTLEIAAGVIVLLVFSLSLFVVSLFHINNSYKFLINENVEEVVEVVAV